MSEQSNDTGLGNVAYVVRSVEGATTIARGNMTNSKIETVDEIHNRLMAYDDIKRENDELRAEREETRFLLNAALSALDAINLEVGKLRHKMQAYKRKKQNDDN